MTKNHTPTHLLCSYHTAGLIFVALGSLFLFVGCTQLYKMIGLTEKQVADQVAEDQKTIIRTITHVRTTTAEILTSAIAGIGAIASGFLAKWLGTERKITKVLITGVEKANDTTVKQSIKVKAVAAGIEPKLAARVRALT